MMWSGSSSVLRRHINVQSRPAHTFPFSAIVGQESLKLALILNAIDSRVGGVLIRGEKGTAKSTAVRALTSVLPPLDVVEGCRFSCDPADPGSWCAECRERRDAGPLPKERRPARLVELPVSATEDRLVGTLDLEHALKHGQRVYEPGLLALANRSVLYVDEVNLLDDHLVDTLLDAAAMGVNTVEREGVSFAHPARFILVGTMNPEEGDIRPQLLDRFGLCVDVESVRDADARVEIVRRRRSFEDDARAFSRAWADAERELEVSVKHARLRLPQVETPDEILYAIANLALTAGVDGHRADQVMARAAGALAALEGRPAVTLSDVARVAPLTLAHRLRRTLFDEPTLDRSALGALIERTLGDASEQPESDAPTAEPGAGQTSIWDSPGDERGIGDTPVQAETLAAPLDRTRRSIAGRRHVSVSDDGRGRYTRSEPAPAGTAACDVALDASIRAAAPFQAARAGESELAVALTPSDLMRKVRTRKVGASIVFAVDASGSMGAANRMEAAKGAILHLLVDAYQRRDRVALVSFRGDSAEVVLAPTASVELANMRLKALPTGGATPLAAGILRSLDVLENERKRDPDSVLWLVLVTDGRGNVAIDGRTGSDDAMRAASRIQLSGARTLVIDAANVGAGASAARSLAEAAGAEYVGLPSMSGATLAAALESRLSTDR